MAQSPNQKVIRTWISRIIARRQTPSAQLRGEETSKAGISDQQCAHCQIKRWSEEMINRWDRKTMFGVDRCWTPRNVHDRDEYRGRIFRKAR